MKEAETIVIRKGRGGGYAMKRACIYFSIAVFLIATSLVAQVAGRNVEVEKATEGVQAKITSTTVELKKGEDVQGKLKQSGIVPNPDAVSLVYALNPKINDVSSVKPGQAITLPVVEGASRNGSVSLLVDPAIKSSLDQQADFFKSQSATKRESQLQSGAKLFVDTVGTLKKSPASQEMLLQTDVIGQLLRAYTHKDTLTVQDVQRIKELEVDLRLKQEAAVKGRADPLIWVETLKKGSTKQVSGYTVYYVPVELYNIWNNRSFPQPSSPTQYRIPVANYYFWAAEPGKSGRATDLKRVEVRTSEKPEVVALTVLK